MTLEIHIEIAETKHYYLLTADTQESLEELIDEIVDLKPLSQ